jgi:hypothetical protein
MSINLDHSYSGNVTLKAENCNYSGCYVFRNPNNNLDNYLLISGDPIDKISGLSSCLASLDDCINYLSGIIQCSNVFFTGQGCFSAVQNVGDSINNIALGNSSIAIGSGAKAIQNFEFAHAGGYFNQIGDAQSSKIISKMVTENDIATTIGYICVCNNTSLSYSNISIGKSISGIGFNSCFAAFKTEGFILKTGSLIELGETSLSTFANTDLKYNLNITVDNQNSIVKFQVNGDSLVQMNWLSDTKVNKITI